MRNLNIDIDPEEMRDDLVAYVFIDVCGVDVSGPRSGDIDVAPREVENAQSWISLTVGGSKMKS